jgi:transposase
LNKVQAFVGFIYEDVRMRVLDNDKAEIAITVAPHGGIKARCSNCRQPSPGYDRLPERRWAFVPLWGISTYFVYAPRRVECKEHGVVVEHIPWSVGKRPVTTAMMGFLARWARRLSWRETATVFGTSWESVYRSVEWFVEYGLLNRILSGIEAIGVDEIHWGHGLKADNFLTVIYQIDAGCKRLLWIGKRRAEKTLRLGLKAARHEQGSRQAVEEHALAVVAQRKPCAGTCAQEAQRLAGQQTGYGAGMEIEGVLPSFLDLQVADLGWRISRGLVHSGPAQPPGADEEGSPNAAGAR